MMQLALSIPPRVLSPVRALRGTLIFTDEAQTYTYIARHHAFHRNRDGVLLRVHPRLTRHGWLLVAWGSGYPWVLGQDKILRRWKAREVA